MRMDLISGGFVKLSVCLWHCKLILRGANYRLFLYNEISALILGQIKT